MVENWKVYKHTGPTNRVYIGITKQPVYKRWNHGQGYSNGQQKFYNAIQKYGWDAFKHEVLYENLTASEAKRIEIKLIAKYKKQRRSYNISDGGDLGNNQSPSPETRRKIAESLKGRKQSQESNNRRSKSLKGKIKGYKYIHKGAEEKMVSPNDIPMYLDKGWQMGRGYVPTELHKQRMSKSITGKKHSDETLQKLRQVQSTKVWVHMGSVNKRINKDELETYLSLGWKRSRIIDYRPTAETITKRVQALQGRIVINNGIQTKRIHPEDLVNYPGWEMGFAKHTTK